LTVVVVVVRYCVLVLRSSWDRGGCFGFMVKC